MHFYSRRDLCMHINCSCGNSLSYSFFSRDVQPAVATGLDNHIRRDKGTGMTDQASNKHIFTCFLVIMYKRRGTESLLPGQWSIFNELLAFLLALIPYANNHVTAKVSDYIDWVEMTGSICFTCGWKPHAVLSQLSLSHSPNFPLRIICHWTAI